MVQGNEATRSTGGEEIDAELRSSTGSHEGHSVFLTRRGVLFFQLPPPRTNAISIFTVSRICSAWALSSSEALAASSAVAAFC